MRELRRRTLDADAEAGVGAGPIRVEIDVEIRERALKQVLKPLTTSLRGPGFFPADFRPGAEDAGQLLVPEFAELVDGKLSQLKSMVTLFLHRLDAQVTALNQCYVAESALLLQRGAAHAADGTPAARTDALQLLDDIVQLETFASVNATGITKILKKLEKLTGLDIREPYLYRISMLPFSKSMAVAELRAGLVSEVVQTAPTAAHGSTDGGGGGSNGSSTTTSGGGATDTASGGVRVEVAVHGPSPKRARTDSLDTAEQRTVMQAITAATRPATAGPLGGAAPALTPVGGSAGGSAASSVAISPNVSSSSAAAKALFRPTAAAAAPRSRSPSVGAGTAASEGGAPARQQIIMTMTGPHGPTMLAGLLAVIATHQCPISDISLTRVHQTLTVGALLDVSPDDKALFASLLAHGDASEAVVNFEVQPDRVPLPYMLSHAPYDRRISHVVTAVSDDAGGVTSATLATIADVLMQNQCSVYRIKRLSQPGLAAVDFKVSLAPLASVVELHKELAALAITQGVDIHMQREAVSRRIKRLVVFDMDSTLIRQECIDELARLAGQYDEVQAVTRRAMEGQLDFKESLRLRVERLAGLPVAALKTVEAALELSPGALDLCRCLRRLGCKLAVVSGGFMPLVESVRARLGLDHAFANHLEVSADGLTLTGRLVGDIVDGHAKAAALAQLAAQYGVDRTQVVAVGDGSNDLPMMRCAGASIAYRAKPVVQAAADFRVNNRSLLTVMYLLGYTDRDIDGLLHDSEPVPPPEN